MSKGVRIIAGKYKGRRLHVPLSEGLRPTGNRMRETLFNWLMHEVRGARCLDAFAGSGALGFEALSRGAREVVLVENHRPSVQWLNKTAADLGCANAFVHHQDTLAYLHRCKEPFDLVFLDPPFAQNYWTPCIVTLIERALLVNGAKLYVESPFEISLTAPQWERLKFKRAGRVNVALYRYSNARS